jgi:hypothetical protein
MYLRKSGISSARSAVNSISINLLPIVDHEVFSDTTRLNIAAIIESTEKHLTRRRYGAVGEWLARSKRQFGRTSESRQGAKAKKLQNIRRRKRKDRSDTPVAKVRHDLSVKASHHHIAAEDHLALIATAITWVKYRHILHSRFSRHVSSCMLPLKSIKALSPASPLTATRKSKGASKPGLTFDLPAIRATK